DEDPSAFAGVAPEAPLAAGRPDAFTRRGLAVVGPSRAATQIEASKACAKRLMQRAGGPTAGYATFADLAAAEAYIRERGAPIVVKASGLAAGKGAVVCDDVDSALAAVRAMLADAVFGEAGRAVVGEE